MARTAIRPVEVISLAVVLAVLVAIAIPAFLNAREKARQHSCRNNLKQLGLSILNYHDTYQRLPFGTIGNSQLPPERRWSWYLTIIPFLEGKAPVISVDPLRDSSDPENWPATFKAHSESGELQAYPLRGFVICPNGERDTGPRNQALATYVGMAGIGQDAALLPLDSKRAGIWGYERQISLKHITGGSSHTLTVIETAKDRGVWLRGGSATVRGLLEAEPPLGPSGQFGGFHPNLTLAIFADASVKEWSDSTDRQVLRKAATVVLD